MDCGSAAIQVNDLIAIDDIVCSPPKKRCKAYDDEGIIMGNELLLNSFLKQSLLSLMDWSQLCINSCRKTPVPCQRTPYETEFRFCFVKSVDTG